jgi:DNA-directed RNA polymerase specialized sigma24 family protein
MSKAYDDKNLIVLIKKTQDNPKEFTNLLVDNIYPTLEQICYKISNDSVVHNLTANASSLINDAYIKLSHNKLKNELDSVQLFFFTLRDVVRSILLDHYQQQKNSHYSKLSNNIDFDFILSKESDDSKFHIEDVDNALTTLLNIDKNASLALSLKFYTASSNNQIASIMKKSTDKVEQYLSGGSKIVNSLMKNPESLNKFCE